VRSIAAPPSPARTGREYDRSSDNAKNVFKILFLSFEQKSVEQGYRRRRLLRTVVAGVLTSTRTEDGRQFHNPPDREGGRLDGPVNGVAGIIRKAARMPVAALGGKDDRRGKWRELRMRPAEGETAPVS
jgi:hypothetical protein